MSACPVPDVRIDCNHGGCTRSEFGSHLGVSDPITAAKARKRLRRLGWLTAVENKTETETYIDRGPRLDYCPDHADEHRGR